jgi:signal transduction histidine kinase
VLAGKPHLIADLQGEADPILQRVHAVGFLSCLSLPLRVPGGISGMLTLSWRRRAGFNSAQLPLLGQIADAVALAVQRWRLFEQVRAGRERLQALSHRLLEVQEVERRHLARELHDEIGQQLTGLKFVFDAARRGLADMAVPQMMEADKLIDGLIGRVRDLSLDLRPAMLDDFGLVSALLWLFDRYTAQTTVLVCFEQQGLEQRFSSEVETAAYRIVQEALTNVARHAGANEVFVRAWTEAEVLNLQVEDNGAGFDPAPSLVISPTGGLPGMRERAFLLGGSLTVESAPGHGTRLRAEFPLRG